MFFNQFIQVLWILMYSMSGLENTDDNTISRRYSALAHSFISLLSPDNGESVNTTNTSPAPALWRQARAIKTQHDYLHT